ncbi:MAG: ABC transporter permease [Christensenellales bacterium]|jgi:ribose/xylose/arabinose/galactoside ABC-type transport system permease subunit
MSRENKIAINTNFNSFFKRTEFTLTLIIVALFLAASVFTRNFTSNYNLTNLTKQGAIVGVMAVAQTAVIIAGGIDISGGAIAGLGCMTMALLQTRTDTPFVVTILACFAVTILSGFINGIIIHDLKVPAMIATLGTQTVVRGIVKLMCNGLNVTYTDGRILNIGTGKLFGIVPHLAMIWIIVAIVVFILLKYTVFGRNLYVIGSSVEVARLSGIKTRKMHYLVYAFAGFLYGVVAIMLAARVGMAQPGTGEGYDMSAIAAAVIGGASLSGGKGAVTGTLLGTVLMALITNAGTAFKIDPYILDITTGVLIVFAVALDMSKLRVKR